MRAIFQVLCSLSKFNFKCYMKFYLIVTNDMLTSVFSVPFLFITNSALKHYSEVFVRTLFLSFISLSFYSL